MFKKINIIVFTFCVNSNILSKIVPKQSSQKSKKNFMRMFSDRTGSISTGRANLRYSDFHHCKPISYLFTRIKMENII